jgi:hypothetical protein
MAPPPQASTSRYHVDVASLALNGNTYDGLWGGGANTASLVLVSGHVDLAGWVKWLLFVALASKFLVGWFRR